LTGRIERMDAEHMSFPDASFDYIWTWGVIHHSADTSRVLREMRRVLRPGGRATVMVYHRSWFYTYVYIALLRGIVLGGFLKYSLHELLQLNTDGAIARFYRRDEWRALVESCGLAIETERIMGQKSEVILLPAGVLKAFVTRVVPDGLTRLLTNGCRQGGFLITTIVKR
jgi:ubiquinone/menaquinone biosynthesis C-methylase UbiE